ncbi:uncharacterized protein LOC113649215 isoform X3, partial [Tachysurus ichikawai]
MGNSISKSKSNKNTVCVTGPNVIYMRNNYGLDSVSQLLWWVTECGFPDGGSFSLKQLDLLKGNLTQMERDNVGKKKKNRVEVNWTAFHMWKLEAEKRFQKAQCTPKRVSIQYVQNTQSTISSSQSLQCLKSFSDDTDLDGPPPRPRLAAAASCRQVCTDPEPARVELKESPPSPPIADRTLQKDKQKETTDLEPVREEASTPEVKEQLQSVITMPMVEVAGPDGDPMLVQRPWTLKDIEHAHEHLPDPREVGGKKFGVELERFCKEFSPTSLELRHLLGRKLEADITQIKYEWPDENLCMRHPDHESGRNATYYNFITELREACYEAFPVKMDMTKIALCKQQDGETVAQYLHCLTEVHNAHSGLIAPENMSEGVVTAYEAHLRNSFMNGLIPEISDKVKNLCITWDTEKLSLIEQHALHAEKLLTQTKQEQGKKERRANTQSSADNDASHDEISNTMERAFHISRKRAISRKRRRQKRKRGREWMQHLRSRRSVLKGWVSQNL